MYFTCSAVGTSIVMFIDASFSCATTDPLDSIDSFFGTDDMQPASIGSLDDQD